MSSPSTYLRVLNNCLSGRSKKIFPNQVVFYNALFGATNPLFLPDEFLEDLNRISLQPSARTAGSSLSDEELIKKVNYLLRSGLDSNSANVGKHINNVPELPIPKQHMAHLTKKTNRDGIVLRLQIIMRFCLSFHPPGFQMDGEDFRRLLECMKAELADASSSLREAEALSVELLGIVVYEVLSAHLDRLQECDYPAQEGRLKVDLQEQRREYEAKADCYRDCSLEKFFALKRLAEENVVAAAVLGDIYYYGRTFYAADAGQGNDGAYRVAADRELAGRYYRKAADCEPPVAGACLSVADMIWNRMLADVREEEAEMLALSYYNRAMKQDYMPAYNRMGEIELAKGKMLLDKNKSLQETGESLPEEEWEEMLFHYCRGLELCDRAGCAGWVYGHMNVADFLENVPDTLWTLIRDRVSLEGPMRPEGRWRAAVDMGSLWAVNRLALLVCREGRLKEAAGLWEQAAKMHYPAAGLNLALYIYGPGCERADGRQYESWLEQASLDGSARASCELAKHNLRTNPFLAGMLLARAQEQNQEKFNQNVYRAIQEIQKKLQKHLDKGY